MINQSILKLFILTLGAFGFLNGASLEFANSMNYKTNYSDAIIQAKKENKTIMLVLSAKSCPWCLKFENQTLRNENIDKQIKTHFIPVVLDNDEDEFPKKFFAQYTPTVLFVDPKTNDYFTQSVGYKAPKKFQESIDEALDDIKRLNIK